MRYDAQIGDLKTALPASSNILVALPVNLNLDNLSSGLSLLLALQKSGKTAQIVSGGQILVEHSSLIGVDQVKNQLASDGAGNLIVTLGGVVKYDDQNNPIIEGLKGVTWHPNSLKKDDLDLVFEVKPGEKIAPTAITPHFSTGKFDLILLVGVANPTDLGSIFTNNQNIFNESKVINIGSIDPNTSLSSIAADIIPSLGLSLDQDIATNLLAGIFTTTNNLQTAAAEDYEAVAQLLRVGGKRPNPPTGPDPTGAGGQPTPSEQDFQAIFQTQPNSAPSDNFVVPNVVSSESTQPLSDNQPSPEEVPMGEGIEMEKPEADWLTPKIYKGTNLN